MNTKISEAAVEAGLAAWDIAIVQPTTTAGDCMRLTLEAALPHLKGDAVPVAWIDLANWKAGIGADECFFTDWQDDDTVPLYLHAHPAAPAEVSGNYGELPPLPGEVSFGHSANGRPYLGYTPEQMQEYARSALAAPGKQRDGEPEIEFQARLMDVKTDLPTENWRHSPTYVENPGRGTQYWVQYRKRYIYYAPPAQGVDLGQLERIRNELHAMSRQVPDEWADPIIELQQDVQKLIDGHRDAAPGVDHG